MTPKERTIAAMNFREPDRVPRFWSGIWYEFDQMWRARHPRDTGDLDIAFGGDMLITAADETAWPSRVAVLEQGPEAVVTRNGWGCVNRTRTGALFSELVEPGVTARVDPDKLHFDSPALGDRYTNAGRRAAQFRDRYYVMAKTGGPYLRAAMARGEENFWIDLVEDPLWAKAYVDHVADHITAIGVESIRRFKLQDTGIAIFDDVAGTTGPFMGVPNYEKIFMPALRRMVKAYKAAGAAKVMHHSDGDVGPLLELWVDAGIDAINPIEYRLGLDPVKIREKFGGKLACVGGLDNCEILPRGDRGEVREHILHLLEAGRGGGLVIGPHSIGPDISVDTMEYMLELLEEFGKYPLRTARVAAKV